MLALTLTGRRRMQLTPLLITKPISSSTAQLSGLGAYTCPGNVCTPSDGSTSTVFRRLQAAANEAAKKLGIGGPIPVDGKIGPMTVAKVYMVSVAMPPRPDLTFLTTMDGQTGPGAVAANAVRVIDELEAVISGEIQMPTHDVGPIDPYPVATTPAPGPGAGPNVTVTTSASPAFKVPPWAGTVGKVALAASVIGIVGVALSRRKKRSSGIAGIFRRRRRR